MIFADKCYTYNLTERKQARIRKRIRRHKPVRNLYVIVLPLLQDGLLEIYPYNQLVLQIIQDMYDETGEEWKVEDFFF